MCAVEMEPGGVPWNLSISSSVAESTLNTFIRDTSFAPARGWDRPVAQVVINYSFPLTTEDYVHRIGRTGRAGKTGAAAILAGALLRSVPPSNPSELPRQSSWIIRQYCWIIVPYWWIKGQYTVLLDHQIVLLDDKTVSLKGSSCPHFS